jgi:hypothetical protein
LKWYFNCKAPGDIYIDPRIPQYHAFITASFGNFIVPTVSHSVLRYGTTHVAVGFVDLALLLDCKFEVGNNDTTTEPITFYGYESSAYAIAKSLIVWDLLQNGDPDEVPSQVVQVWYSAVWTKRTTNAFLAAAKRVLGADACSSTLTPLHPRVAVMIRHWSRSKGVGLKRTMKLRYKTRKEMSYARHFVKKCDRVEMLRYFLTGEFGLDGEAPCSGSVTMWDCPEGTPPLQRDECVFNTMLLNDVNWKASFGMATISERPKKKKQPEP